MFHAPEIESRIWDFTRTIPPVHTRRDIQRVDDDVIVETGTL